MKKFLPRTDQEGFSLIELVIVIAVLAILSVVGFPYFLKVINMARFSAAKAFLSESYTSCINNSNQSPNAPNIPGVTFQSTNCSSLMSATIDEKCTISLNLSNGAKTGWEESFDSCTTSNGNVNGNGNGNENGNGNGNGNNNGNGSNDDAIANYCDKDPKPSACQTTGLGGYAIVNPNGEVLNVIVATSDHIWGSPGFIPDDLDSTMDGCNGDCKLVRQSNGPAYWGTYSHSEEKFTLDDGTIIKDGVGLRPNGDLFDTGNGEILN